MSTLIKIKRGTKAAIDGAVLSAGELALATDTKEVYVGDGTVNHLTGKAMIGVFASRPAASTAGRVYLASDTAQVFIDTGTAWIDPVVSLINDTATATTSTWSSVKIRAEIDLAAATLGTQAEWQESVIDRLAAPPVSPATGDRYLVVATASGAWTGEENNIAEWDGSAWQIVIPTVGTYVSVDAEADGLYYFGGSTWTKKYYEATTASNGLIKDGVDIQIDPDLAGNGLAFASGVLSNRIDGLSIKYDALNDNQIYVDTVDGGAF